MVGKRQNRVKKFAELKVEFDLDFFSSKYKIRISKPILSFNIWFLVKVFISVIIVGLFENIFQDLSFLLSVCHLGFILCLSIIFKFLFQFVGGIYWEYLKGRFDSCQNLRVERTFQFLNGFVFVELNFYSIPLENIPEIEFDEYTKIIANIEVNYDLGGQREFQNNQDYFQDLNTVCTMPNSNSDLSVRASVQKTTVQQTSFHADQFCEKEHHNQVGDHYINNLKNLDLERKSNFDKSAGEAQLTEFYQIPNNTLKGDDPTKSQ